MEQRYESLVQHAKTLGASDAKLMEVSAIQFDPRSILKCTFGCNRYGKFWTCRPNIGLSSDQFKEALDRYSTAIVIKCPEPRIAQDVTLGIEKKAMMDYGAVYAFALVLCVLCEECAFPDPCRFPHLARPAMDALGMDIGKTVEPLGFKVEFDPQGNLVPAWYSMVLLDQIDSEKGPNDTHRVSCTEPLSIGAMERSTDEDNAGGRISGLWKDHPDAAAVEGPGRGR